MVSVGSWESCWRDPRPTTCNCCLLSSGHDEPLLPQHLLRLFTAELGTEGFGSYDCNNGIRSQLKTRYIDLPHAASSNRQVPV